LDHEEHEGWAEKNSGVESLALGGSVAQNHYT